MRQSSERAQSDYGPQAQVEAAAVGRPAPAFDLLAANQDADRSRVSLADYAGKWLLLLFYPRDYSFVCPTELTSYSSVAHEYNSRGCHILAMGVDTIELHEEWLNAPQVSGGLGPMRFPLASDVAGEVSRAYGVFLEDQRVAGRGLFLIDPSGVLQYKVVHNLRIGRSTGETLRVLDALRQGGLCPSGWTLGDGTIDPAQALTPGRVLGHYRIVRRLGEGGFGQVYKAWDLWLHREVALKVRHPGKRADTQRMLAEARRIAGLNHPNISTIYAVEEQDGLPVISMELLDGMPLSSWLSQGRLTEDQVFSVAQQVALALAASHQHGVVHGDFKPANVVVSEGGIAKIVDFGLARAAPAPDDDSTCSTESGPGAEHPTVDQYSDGPVMFRGTPTYMSPEQADGVQPAAASDVFAFGLVLYEMLTGRRARKRRSLAKAMHQVRHENLVPLAKRVPQSFRQALAACLRRDPARRPTMAELVEAFGGPSLGPPSTFDASRD
ncbi:MAG: protein kinase [Deltaproteobacteria bacterium]|nr:protein kinase [Deltaproteobacteria bacterium]